MSTPEEPEAPLPKDPLECRQEAERLLGQGTPSDTTGRQRTALVWALLAVAGELATIRRELLRRR